MNVFDLFAKISLDTSEYDNGLNEASSKSSSFASKIGGGLATAGKMGALAIAAVGTATVAVTKDMISGASEVAVYGDNIDKMSQKMGLTAEAYQEWDAVMQHSGTSMETMKASMKTLANAVETGNDAFEKLGLTQEQLAEMSQQDIFEATIAALQNVEDTTERTYLAGKLLGRGATELGALLNTSAEDTQAMRDRVHELGGVMSDDAVKAAAQFQDNLQDLQTAFSGIKRGIMSDLLPGLNTLMDGFTRLLAGEDGANELIADGFDNLIVSVENGLEKAVSLGEKILPKLINTVVDHLPDLMQLGLMVIETIGSAIIQNLPELIKSGLDIIVTLADSLIENLPTLIPAIVDIVLEIVDTLTDPDTLVNLIDAALQIILALADGIINALPKLIEKAPEIIVNLVEAIVRAAPMLLQAGIELIVKLIEGIYYMNEQIKGAAKEVFNAIKNTIKDKISEAKQWGKDLISNFVQGIKDMIGKVKDVLVEVGQTVVDFLGFSEPKKGPLSNFHTYSPDMIDLWNKGIEDNAYKLEDQLTKSFDFSEDLVATVNPTAVVKAPALNGATSNMQGMENATFVIPVYVGGDKVDEHIINAVDAYNHRSGGR